MANLDRNSIIEAIRDDEYYDESYELFCDLQPQMEHRLRTAAQAADLKGLRESAHMLKSRLRFLGCFQLGKVAAQLEAEAFGQCDQDYVRRVDDMLSDIRTVMEEIDSILNSEKGE